MKKIPKPFILKSKHVAQSKKVFQPYWNKTEKLFIRRLNSPPFQFSIEQSLQLNWLFQQLIIDFVTQQQQEKNPPKLIWTQPHKYNHSATAMTSGFMKTKAYSF